MSDNNKILWYGFYQTLWNAVSACLWHFRRFFFLSCRAKNRKMPEKRCQTWCLFMGCVSGILARIISLYSKKCSWFSNSRKLNILLQSASPAQPDTKEPMGLSPPFTGWHLQSKWGFTERIPGRNAPIMEKGMFQIHFIGISLGYNKSFPFIVSVVKEESCLLMWAFIVVMQKIPC